MRSCPPSTPAHRWARQPCATLARKAFQSTSRSASLARISTKAMPCSTMTDASGSPRRRCNRLPAAPKPPNRMATGMMANRVVPRHEGHQDARVAVACDQRRVGAGVHRRHFHRAGQARAGAAHGAGRKMRRDAGRPTSCAVRGLPPTTRTAKPDASICSHTCPGAMQATTPKHQAPVDVRARRCRQCAALGQRKGRRLVQAGRVAQRPFDPVLEQADGHIGQQQAADGFVDAAVLPQPARQHDPQRTGRRTGAHTSTVPTACWRAAAAHRATRRRPARPAPAHPRRR
jgi:hypothetical protein